MTDREPVRFEVFLDREVLLGEHLPEHVDAQDAYRHVSQLDRAEGDVGHLGDGRHELAAAATAVRAVGRGPQLTPGSSHDAADQGLRSHDFEDVADIRQQYRDDVVWMPKTTETMTMLRVTPSAPPTSPRVPAAAVGSGVKKSLTDR